MRSHQNYPKSDKSRKNNGTIILSCISRLLHSPVDRISGQMGGNTLQFRVAISLRLKVFSDSCLNYLFRPHSVGGCYQTGYMANGKLTFVKSAACSNGPPKGGVWFPVSVTVHGQDVQVYHSGVLVASIKSHFAPRAWGGVFTFHGYKNVVLFRKFKIAPQTYITKRCKKVVRNIYDTKVALDASQ